MSAPTTIAGSLVTPESPWLGLRSFTEDAQAYFFGRSAELDDLYERILDKPLAILFGQSGLGKSSLLQAALVPRLRATGFLPVFVRFDHDPSAPALEHQFLWRLRGALESGAFDRQAATLTTALADGQPTLDYSSLIWLLLHDPNYGLIPPRGAASDGFPRPVFLIDQFEEIFTLGDRTARRATSGAFRETLAALVENRPPASLRVVLERDDDLAERLDYQARCARVLLSLREDFLHVLERWRRVMPSLMENRLELRMLNGPQAFLAVVRPGQLRSASPPIIPDQVGQAIVRFVAGAGDEVFLGEIDAVPPLLSLVCAELNAQRLDSGELQITQSQFEGHGTDILKSFYIRSFDLGTYGSALEGVAGADLALANLRGLIEDRLLSPDGFRESIALDTIARELSHTCAPGAYHTVLDQLVQRRLLTVEERGGVRRVELAHDVLTGIVKASRDERHEVEAIAKARADQARAEAETARIRQERNRFQRLAILASCLAVVAVASAVLAWIGFRRSREARDLAVSVGKEALTARNDALESAKQALAARNQAQVGFQSAWSGLTALYDEYAAGTLENTHGISRFQANQLKSNLRGHLLTQLRKLNQDHPDHRDTVHYVARLLVDEGREAISDRDYERAQARLTEALQWSQRRPPDSASQAEIYGEILLEQARIPSIAGDGERAALVASNNLSTVRSLASRWPESWRLEYLVIRLENVQLNETINNAQAISKLAKRLIPLIEKSAQHFDPVVWHFVIESNLLRGEDLAPISANYQSVRELIASFREKIVQRDQYTLVQIEIATEYLIELLPYIPRQLLLHNVNATADDRRAILNELEATATALETRLPKSVVVYGVRGNVLHLQESCISAGINTRTPDELRAAVQRHRLVASALGVSSGVADALAAAFIAYTSENSDPESKAAALGAVNSSLRDFLLLDLVGVDTVLQRTIITGAGGKLEALKSDDPLALIYKQILDRYIELYTRISKDSRAAFVGTVASFSTARIQKWYDAKQYAPVVEFWDRFYRGVPIRNVTSGDKEELINHLNLCAMSLLRIGRRDDAQQLLNDMFAACERTLENRPWHFYVRTAMFGMCFDAAKVLSELGELEKAQAWLRRGWAVYKEYSGSDIDLANYSQLPLKGAVPENIPEDDDAFFARMNSTQEGGGLGKEFNIPIEINGVKYAWNLWLVPGPKGYQRVLDQFRWLSEVRGARIPAEIQTSFKRLNDIAVQNKVDFRELCIYAFETAAKEAATEMQKRLEAAIGDVKKSEAEYSKNKSDANRLKLAAAYSSASDRALYVKRWTDAETWARKLIELDGNYPLAQRNLATACLFQGKYEQALEIYRTHWHDPTNGKTLGDEVLADFKALKKAGITHPDVARIRAAFGKKPDSSLDGDEKPKAASKP
jgi:tetratricopeptide (TPR) repeat protein